MEKDKNLLGNKRIEDAIADMYKDLTDENLTKVIYIIRERIKENGHFVVAVKPGNDHGLVLRTVSTQDGNKWFAAFTSLEEEIKKKEDIVSGFTAEMSSLFEMTLNSNEICGIIINPWDKALKLTKELVSLLM